GSLSPSRLLLAWPKGRCSQSDLSKIASLRGEAEGKANSSGLWLAVVAVLSFSRQQPNSVLQPDTLLGRRSDQP
ncbi:hypothetical protein P7K49_023602, partial [Saguinus oedipus]